MNKKLSILIAGLMAVVCVWISCPDLSASGFLFKLDCPTSVAKDLRPLSFGERSGPYGAVIKKIQTLLPPEQYGYYQLLRSPDVTVGVKEYPFGEDDTRIGLVFQGGKLIAGDGWEGRGFACLTAARSIYRWCEEMGIPATLCIGKTSLWDVHYYVTTNDGTKLSGTPDVAYVNGDIAETRKIDAFTRNRLFTEHDTAIPIDSGFSPMVWHPLGDRSGLLSSAGIDIGLLLDRHSTQNFDIRFFHEVQLVESGRETGSLRVRVTIPKDQLIKIQQALAAVPASETVQELQRLGIEVNIVASFLRPASEAQIINEQSRTIDALHFLITKLSREIVDRFTYAPRSVVDHPDYGNRLRHHASVPALSQI